MEFALPKIVSFSLLLFTMIIIIISLPTFQAYAHVGDGGEEVKEQLVLSSFVRGNINISAEPESEQWKQSTENIVESAWQHKVQVISLNNSSHIFFLLSWDDTTRATEGMSRVADGAAIFFETTQTPEDNNGEGEALAEESGPQPGDDNKGSAAQEEGEEKEELWYWSTNPQTSKTLNIESALAKAEWDHDHWNVLMGRKTITDNGSSIAFKQGVREEGFVKIAIWDGNKNESFDQIDDEELTHFDFVMLPEINVYPKDVYAWSGILAAGTGVFLLVELRMYKKRQKQGGEASTTAAASREVR